MCETKANEVWRICGTIRLPESVGRCKMDRASYGRWGADLSEEEFAKRAGNDSASIVRTFDLGRSRSVASDVAKRISKRIEAPSEPLRCEYFITLPNEWRQFAEVPSPKELSARWDKVQPKINRPKFEIELDEELRRYRDPRGAGWPLDFDTRL